ncbi:regulator of g protein signaling [Anaeramoeba flamelloides]|uniref:Regulator of g protein signaling n=1 Tax=Anaeramoeba flamelloides TaxID=1746091 RepID=A0AAV8A2H9_9EUKA|nr:regulator of g protein signaling [Anaeramoeba flamelloides]
MAENNSDWVVVYGATHEEAKKFKYSQLEKQRKKRKRIYSGLSFLHKTKKNQNEQNINNDILLNDVISDEVLDEIDTSSTSSSTNSTNETKEKDKKKKKNNSNDNVNDEEDSNNEIEDIENSNQDSFNNKVNQDQDINEETSESGDENLNYYIKHRARTTNRSIIIICILLFTFHLTLALITYYSSSDYRDKDVGCTLKFTGLYEKIPTSTTVFLIPFMSAKFFTSVVIPVIFSYIKEYKFNVLDEKKLIEFRTILENPIPLEYFKKFCINDFCVENIMFWLSVGNFKELVEEEERKEAFDECVNLFIRNGARYQINISYSNKNTLLSLSDENKGEVGIFDKARKEIYNLMQRNTFVEFIGSSVWKEMIIKLKEDKQIQLINRYSTLV